MLLDSVYTSVDLKPKEKKKAVVNTDVGQRAQRVRRVESSTEDCKFKC